MRHYETVFILKNNVNEKDTGEILDRVRVIIEKDGGNLARTDEWGVRTLAYVINKERLGRYFLLEYGAVPGAVEEMERIFRIDERILKYLTVKRSNVFDPAAVGTRSLSTVAVTPLDNEESDFDGEEQADDQADN